MMNSVAPVWDGNETWLVLGGGGLFAAFPLAYANLMPALYVPIIAMLIGLVFRGVAFDFRRRGVGLADAVQHPHRQRAGRRLWPARRHLAGDEDHRRVARSGLSPQPVAVDRNAGRDRRRQCRDAVPRERILAALG